MILGFDHAIYLVAGPDGLDAAAQRFAGLGFTITERGDEGKDAAATAQKLICFADGSYIEILAIREAAARRRHRFASLLHGNDGWADTSVHTDDLAAMAARLQRASLPFRGPLDHERRLSSGERWGVSLILPGIGAGHPALPFLLEDTAGRDLRIPTAGRRHASGVAGTAGMTVSVRDLDLAAPGFDTLLGTARDQASRLHPARRCRRYRVGRQWLDVIEQPDAPEGLLSVALSRPEQDEVVWLATGRNALAIVPA